MKLELGSGEEEGLEIRVLREALPPRVEFGKFIGQVFRRAGERRAIDFRTHVADWIVECRKDGGLPLFRTRYGGERFDDLVLGVCWAGRGRVEGEWFRNIPKEDLELMETKMGEWKDLVEKYGTPEQVAEAMRSPLLL